MGLCHLKNLCAIWNWATKMVCDGACLVYNKVLNPVLETVKTTGQCVGKAGKEIISSTAKCAKAFPHCAKSATCYISKGAQGAGKCAGGMIIPSKQCLQESGFID